MRLFLLLKFSVCLSSSVGLALGQSLLVGAASDLAPLETPLRQGFTAATGQSIKFSFGSSGTLAEQVRNGAPFDVYLSANEEFVKNLAAEGKIEAASVRVYALGILALWSATGPVKTIRFVAESGVRYLAIANPKHAPYGVAAEQALAKAGLLEAVRAKIVYAENVRQAYEFARSGNADVCLTAMALVASQGGMAVPRDLYEPIRQAGGIVTGAKNRALAGKFLDFLVSPDGQRRLQDGGLEPVATSRP
jgi:molybdate transport system substrate-binding protein